VIQTAILLLAAGALRPADAEPPSPEHRSRWFVRAGALRAHYNSGARIALDGSVLPDATAHVTHSSTLIFDVGYDLTDDVSLMAMGGIPPTAKVIGKGSVEPFGELGKVRFGPAVLTIVYRLPGWHGLRPYVGAGAAHLFILKAYDRSVTGLKVRDHNGLAVQAGVEYSLSRKWGVFADYKHIGLHVNATGALAGEPVRARVKLNPDLMSAGVKYHFD
jgi:outer membrane protein